MAIMADLIAHSHWTQAIFTMWQSARWTDIIIKRRRCQFATSLAFMLLYQSHHITSSPLVSAGVRLPE